MRYLLAVLSLFWWGFVGCSLQKSDQGRPNIVVILADDVGWSDLNCYDPLNRGYYETPHLDQLARQGMRFLDAYANPSCSPTRAALMSGQYYPHQPVYDVGPPAPGLLVAAPNTDDLPVEKITLAEALKSGGYKTGFIGKWHIGNAPENGPIEQGFDVNIGGYRALSPRWPGGYFEPNNNPHIDDAVEGEYLTDYLTRKGIEYIEASQNEPFYLQLSYYSVHVPLQAPEELVEKYRKKTGSRGHDNPTYAAMLDSLDRGVGKIMEALERLDLDDNTIVVFYSDNGGFGGYSSVGITDPKVDITDNAPLRNGKNSFYEGGIRVPLMIRWPGVVPSGTECAEPVIHVDLYPTILDAARLDFPDGYHLDGVNLLPLIKDSDAELDRDALYWHFPGYTMIGVEGGPQTVIREGPWKLIKRYEDNSFELYNLVEDIGESRNLSDTHPAIRDYLRKKIEEWLIETNAPLPTAKGA